MQLYALDEDPNRRIFLDQFFDFMNTIGSGMLTTYIVTMKKYESLKSMDKSNLVFLNNTFRSLSFNAKSVKFILMEVIKVITCLSSRTRWFSLVQFERTMEQ